MLIVIIIENNAMYSMQELHIFLYPFLPAIFTSLTVSVHSSTNLSANFFLHLIFYNLGILQLHMIHHIHTHIY